MAAKEFNDANFAREVLQATRPVLVDFWAPWCPPCRQIAPIVEQLAMENAASVTVGKFDIDQSPETPQSYGIANIPTMLLFKDGRVIEKFVGVQPKSRLQSAIDAVAS